MGENKHTSDDLKYLQALPLNLKIAMTKARIRDFVNVYEPFVSFSGGKDSTVLLHIARSMYPDIPAVFVDTGLEYPEIKEFVRSMPNVEIIRPKMTFREVIAKYGYPVVSKEIAAMVYSSKRDPNCKRAKYLSGEIENRFLGGKGKWWKLVDAPFVVSARCCDVMKKNPAHQYERETGRKAIIATMASESLLRRQKWLQQGCNAFDAKNPASRPMSFWTEQDVLRYLKEYKVPYAYVYGDIVETPDGKLHTTGCQRTGCVFCGFGAHLEKEPNRFQRLKQTHPKLWDYCMRPWNRGGLGMKEVLEFIGVKTE